MPTNPFQYLENAGNHADTWLLLYGPILCAIVLAIVVGLWVYWRRRRERDAFDREFQRQDPREIEARSIEQVVAHENVPLELQEIRGQDQNSWLARLKSGLQRTRTAIELGARDIFVGRVKLDQIILERLHELLYRADVGVRTADRLIEGLKSELAHVDEVDWPMVQKALLLQTQSILNDVNRPIAATSSGPLVILVVGVNGVGKTTTIGKLSARYKAAGKNVMVCAADTFRAAAIEQLQTWGDRIGVPVIKQHQGADPAAVAYDGVQAAKARAVDILIVDTAGRLHSKTELMDELAKIKKSIGKDLPGAPHETWLVLDATTGQNAVQQCKAFHDVTQLTGLVVTKLDGTAKGGVIIGIADQFKLPIRYIGVGEKAADLRDFVGDEYAAGVFGG